MKCEECLQLIEEYFDGELAEQTALRLSAHLAHCSACARVAEGLRLETEIYRSYERPVAVTPALWQAIKERIANENPSRAQLYVVKRFGWLAGAFSFPRPAPILAAVALIALCISFAFMYLKKSPETEPTRASIDSSNINSHSGTDNVKGTVANTGAVASPTNPHAEDSNRGFGPRPLIVRRRKNTGSDGVRLRSSAGGTARANVSNLNDQLPQTANVTQSAERASTSADFASAGDNRHQDFGDPDAQWRAHAERAQILLRAFRNVPFAEETTNSGPRIDVAYERQQSKKLLYDNIVLRREAAARGDRSTERLLDNLEPILLDIANLPERPRPADVRFIEGRMQKEEIVARLQVQSLSAPDSFD